MPQSATENQKTAALMRETLSETIEKRGFGEDERRRLRDIFLFEGEKCAENFIGAYDLAEFTEELFCAAAFYFALGGTFANFRISGEGVYKVNLRLYEIAVLSLLRVAENGAKISFSARDDFVLLTVDRVAERPDTVSPLGTLLFERKEKAAEILIPLKRERTEKPDKIKTEHLWSRYSVVDAFIGKEPL